MTSDFSAAQPPDPKQGWARDIVELHDAVVMAPENSRFRQHCGVFDRDGNYCPQGATWRYNNRMTLHPKSVPNPQGRIPGRWLWGGLLFHHFGHFLVESTARLWALEHYEKPLSGIVFVNKRPRMPPQLGGFQRDFIDLLMRDVPVYIVKPAARFEELVVPGQGFGLGDIAAATPEFRQTFSQKLSQSVAPQGARRLYVSRSKLPLETAGMIGESKLETLLERCGYTIFHPQDHSIKAQIAAYRAAEDIIIADGSAAHLLGFVCRPDQRIAYIVRRSSWSEEPISQIESFRGTAIHVLDELHREWIPRDPETYRQVRIGELDLEKIGQSLKRAGFIDTGVTLPQMSRPDAEAILADQGLFEAFVPA